MVKQRRVRGEEWVGQVEEEKQGQRCVWLEEEEVGAENC